jgi:TRAP-type transport system periplasmic protein
VRRLQIWFAVLVAAAGLAACTTSGDRAGGTLPSEPYVITVLNTRSADDLKAFSDEVEALSDGQIVLSTKDMWHANDLNGEADAIGAVAAGQATLGYVPTRAFDGFGVTEFDALAAPLLVDSLTLEEQVLGSDLAASMMSSLNRLGLKGLAILPGPIRRPIGLSRPLVRPQDFVGARIAFSPSPLAERSLRALGAEPVASAFNGASMAGFDGLELHVESVAGNGYDRAGTAITANVALWPRPVVLFANSEAFAALPADQQNILIRAATLALPASTQQQRRASTEGVTLLCRRGEARFVDATAVELAAMRASFNPVMTFLRQRDPFTAHAIDRITALRLERRFADAAEVPECPADTAQPVTSRLPTPIDGVYTVHTQASDYPAEADWDFAGEADAPENWGDWVFVLDRGRFALTQSNQQSCTWAYGVLTVKDNLMTWDVIDGGGIAPTNAANKPGEHFVYRWSLYKETLTLTPSSAISGIDSDAWAALPYRLKPWRRVSDTPTSSMLASRCPPPSNALQ